MLSFSRSSNNLTISQYGVSQVSRNVRGEAVPQGAPVKVYSYEWNPVKRAMIITSRSPPPEFRQKGKIGPYPSIFRSYPFFYTEPSPGKQKTGLRQWNPLKWH